MLGECEENDVDDRSCRNLAMPSKRPGCWDGITLTQRQLLLCKSPDRLIHDGFTPSLGIMANDLELVTAIDGCASGKARGLPV